MAAFGPLAYRFTAHRAKHAASTQPSNLSTGNILVKRRIRNGRTGQQGRQLTEGKGKHKVKSKSMNVLALLGASFLAVPLVYAQDPQPKPDNTKVNQRDRDSASPTADNQKMNPADRETTKKIRAAIHDDKSLSTYAHNIKVITQDGKVTLKGPVRSEDEKSNIAIKATQVAGDGNVDNQLDVAPPKQ
jgi:hyperosmotically inducible protein